MKQTNKQLNRVLVVVISVLFASSLVTAETEVTGKITYEAGAFSKSGSTIGDFGNSTYNGDAVGGAAYRGITTTATPSHNSNNLSKSESKAQIFFDGDIKDSTFHVEVQGVFDGKAVNSYDSIEEYTQRDPLREAYMDSEYGDWSVRAGKQQVVWGTADGMKLLDMINPTDYSEMAQNQMEDSRITTWMLNAEKDLEGGSNIQVIISQPKENIFAGLNRGVDIGVRENSTVVSGTAGDASLLDITLNNGTDTGHAFMMKGPDTITGVSNGFLNIVPDLGSVAGQFAYAFGGLGNLGAANMEGFKVGNEYDPAGTSFASMTMTQMATAMGGALPTGFATAVTNTWNGLVGQMGSAANVQAALGLGGATQNDLDGFAYVEIWLSTALQLKSCKLFTGKNSGYKV